MSFFLFFGNSFVSLTLMTGWNMSRPLVFPLISAIRGEPITLSRCSWFWNCSRFGFSLHLPLLLWVPKCSFRGSWQNLSERRKRAFSVAKRNFLTSLNDSLKREKLMKLISSTKTSYLCWLWTNLYKALRELMESEELLGATFD